MKIDLNTRISRIIKHDRRAIETIASISDPFKKLRNPILRKVLAPRVSIGDAARIGGVKPGEFFRALQKLGFEIDGNGNDQGNTGQNDPLDPAIQAALKKQKCVTLDVRPDLQQGVDPFKHIQDVFQQMEGGNVLEIINSFEPTPLIRIMKGRGILSGVLEEPSLVKTYFLKEEQKVMVQKGSSGELVDEQSMQQLLQQFKGMIRELDVRMMEMPGPMVTILGELENLEEGEALYIHHKRVPKYLLAELESRKISVYIQRIDQANVKLLIHR